jgi:hypothetical protein
MRFSLRAVAIVSVASLAFACGGGSQTSQPSPSAAPGTTAAAPAAGAPTVAAGDFGVPECDSFMKKWVACLDKVPEAARTAARQTLDQTKAAWQQAASTPEGKSALAATCTQMESTTKQAMSAYGCQW